MKVVARTAGWRSSVHERKPHKISQISTTETFPLNKFEAAGRQWATTGKGRIRSKITDENSTKNGWTDIVFAQEEAKQNQPRILYRNLSSTHAASKPSKLTVSNVLIQFSLGAVGDTLAGGVPYEILVPQNECALQSENCHFIRGLCVPVVSLCGSVGWWGVVVIYNRGFQRMKLSMEHACESPCHGSPQAGLYVCFPCTLCFLLRTWKRLETTAGSWRRQWIWSPPWIKQPRRKCASCLHKKTHKRPGQQKEKNVQVKNWQKMTMRSHLQKIQGQHQNMGKRQNSMKCQKLR